MGIENEGPNPKKMGIKEEERADAMEIPKELADFLKKVGERPDVYNLSEEDARKIQEEGDDIIRRLEEAKKKA